MMLTAGLSPAWQQILVFDGLTPGEVNRARDVFWCASGKVLNAGMACHRLGGDSRTLALVGGESGVAIARDLAEQGIPRRLVQSRERTRICTTLIDRRGGGEPVVTELVENARPVDPKEMEEFLRVYAEEAAPATIVLLIGSTPAGTSPDLFRVLLERTPGEAVVDAWGEQLLRALERRPLVVKPNRDELSRTLGKELRTDAQLKAAMTELHRRGAQWVVVTQGEGDTWLRTVHGDFFRFRPPDVDVVNPTACGDCFAAGLTWAIHDGCDVLGAVPLGLGAAAQNIGDVLPSRLDRATVEDYAADIEISRERG